MSIENPSFENNHLLSIPDVGKMTEKEAIEIAGKEYVGNMRISDCFFDDVDNLRKKAKAEEMSESIGDDIFANEEERSRYLALIDELEKVLKIKAYLKSLGVSF